MFNIKEVEEGLKKALTGTNQVLVFNNEEANKNLNDLIEKLSKFKLWVIYALPNGNLDYSCEDVYKNYKLYKDSQVFSKGKIIVSEKLQEKLKNEKNQ